MEDGLNVRSGFTTSRAVPEFWPGEDMPEILQLLRDDEGDEWQGIDFLTDNDMQPRAPLSGLHDARMELPMPVRTPLTK